MWYCIIEPVEHFATKHELGYILSGLIYQRCCAQSGAVIRRTKLLPQLLTGGVLPTVVFNTAIEVGGVIATSEKLDTQMISWTTASSFHFLRDSNHQNTV